MSGMMTSRIARTDITDLEEIYASNPRMGEYIAKANKILENQESLGIVTMTVQDAGFPKRLIAIGDDCPAVIYCLGNMDLLERENPTAIIGARACDRQGYEAAFSLATKYASIGSVIVSGLALGCDTAAHRGALSINGETIAVVATGLNLVHPKENRQLQDEIIAHGGLILSEQPFGIKANPTRLIARNRIQAALSDAVILAQCPSASGSLHTMRFARKYHKKCYAYKFPALTAMNEGNFNLLSDRQAEAIEITD